MKKSLLFMNGTKIYETALASLIEFWYLRFTSSSPELNWLFDAYIRPQPDNMHGGVPSDCPHRERLGYIGDGQITAPAAMALLDTKDFYRKWIRDIFDSQDQLGIPCSGRYTKKATAFPQSPCMY